MRQKILFCQCRLSITRNDFASDVKKLTKSTISSLKHSRFDLMLADSY